jgi:hypothetical protein
MSFSTTNLGAYIASGKDYAIASVKKSDFAQLLMSNGYVQFGKGPVAVSRIDSGTGIQLAEDCGSRANLATINLSSKVLSIMPLASYANYCPKKLWGSFLSTSLIQGQQPTEDFIPAFVDALMTDRSAKLAAKNEEILWKGNESGSGELAVMDGILEQLNDAGKTGTTVSGTDMVAKLQNVFTGSSVDVRHNDDFHIFVSPEVFAEYSIGLANRNLFAGNDLSVAYGTTAKIKAVGGMTGSRKAVACRLSAFQLGVDAESDMVNATLEWSNETKQHYADFNYGMGIVVVFPEEVFVGIV